MLEVETEESRQRYTEAKREAKKVVRRARMKSGMTLVESWKQMPRGGRRGYKGKSRDEIFRRVKDEEGMIVGDEEMVVDR